MFIRTPYQDLLNILNFGIHGYFSMFGRIWSFPSFLPNKKSLTIKLQLPGLQRRGKILEIKKLLRKIIALITQKYGQVK